MNSIISIIVPCYNQAQYLSDALQSVLEQTYTHWECIIVNDGSPDNTEQVAQEWLQRDSRFKYIYKENGGLSSARNTGIEIAKGKYILPLDADDKIGNEYLKIAINEFEKNSGLKVVYCKAEKFGDETGEWLLEPFNLKRLTVNNMIFTTAMYRKSDWKRVNGYDVNMVTGLEDWEFWISLLKNGGNVFQIDNVLFFYRIKDSSRQSNLKLQEKEKLFEYISIKHADFFVRYFGSFKKIHQDKLELINKLKSEKYLINILCKRLFGFKLFRNIQE